MAACAAWEAGDVSIEQAEGSNAVGSVSVAGAEDVAFAEDASHGIGIGSVSRGQTPRKSGSTRYPSQIIHSVFLEILRLYCARSDRRFFRIDAREFCEVIILVSIYLSIIQSIDISSSKQTELIECVLAIVRVKMSSIAI